MARKFLYVIAAVTVLFLLLMAALRLWSEDLTEMAFVPDVPFVPLPAMPANAWEDPRMWIARPGLKDDPSTWMPPPPAAATTVSGPAPVETNAGPFAVFFIHPTSYIEKGTWNADLSDPVSRARAALFVKAMASPFNMGPFNQGGRIWAPRYRQAAVGAFLTDKPEAARALDLAYGDVLAAFAVFVKENPGNGPIVLAGHSQGAYLLRRLLRDRVAGTPLAARVAAAYVIGWPVSIEHDLPRMGLPACDGPDQGGCVSSWLSVADPADTAMLTKAYARRPGLDDRAVGQSAFLCTNPLTGTRDGQSDAAANLGTMVPDFEAGTGELVPRVVPAACGPDHFLHLGPPPKLDLGAYVLPGNNYHVYDITLFWANLRADVARRVAAWRAAQASSAKIGKAPR